MGHSSTWFDDTQIRALTQSLLEDSALEQAKVPVQFQEVIADMCAGAHFHTKGVKTSVLTHRGTQPGRSTADLLYNICMRRKMQVIQERLKSEGLIQSLEWFGNSLQFADSSATEQCVLTDAIFVDDMVIMTSPEKVTDIIPQAQAIATNVDTTMDAHGAQVNSTAGKTEAMINARGEGAPAFRRHMWLELQNNMLTAVGDKQVCLRVVENTSI